MYIGSSYSDVECIKMAGFSVCPEDAVSEVKCHSDIVAPYYGGAGVLCYVYELLANFKLNHNYFNPMNNKDTSCGSQWDDCYGIVYIITNLVNSKKYIGQTIQKIDRRLSQHFSDARRGKMTFICYKEIWRK